MTTQQSRRLPTTRQLRRWFLVLPLLLLAASTIYPLFFTFNVAVKDSRDFIVSRFDLTTEPSFANFERAWTFARIGESFWNSVITTAGAVLLLTLVCSMAAYAIGIMRFRWRGPLFLIILMGMMVPLQVVMVPFFRTAVDFHLLNTYHGLIIAYTTFAIPFGTYMLAAYYSNIPREIFEAAKIDGASTLQSYYKIVLPLGKPAIATLAIINTLFAWNDLLIPLLIMQKREMRTIMVGIATLRGEHQADMPLFAAAIILGVLPVLIVFLVFQSKLTAGMTAGAVKS
ncbi:MAG: carbohydrate ABC transporter permease [Chloroflexi bacterium]|nr:carbohydrate ABC transporter permease [Chloroflexota bacterium]